MKIDLSDIFEEELGIVDITDEKAIAGIPEEKLQKALARAQARVDAVMESVSDSLGTELEPEEEIEEEQS